MCKHLGCDPGIAGRFLCHRRSLRKETVDINMNVNWSLIIIAVISGAFAAIPGILALRGQYKQQSADASSSNVDTAIKLKDWMEDEISKLKTRCSLMERQIERQESEIDELSTRVRMLARYARLLIQQVIDNELEPVVSLEQVNHIMEIEK